MYNPQQYIVNGFPLFVAHITHHIFLSVYYWSSLNICDVWTKGGGLFGIFYYVWLYTYDQMRDSLFYSRVCEYSSLHLNSFKKVGYSFILESGRSLLCHIISIRYPWYRDSTGKYLEGIWFPKIFLYYRQEIYLCINNVCVWHAIELYLNKLWLSNEFWWSCTTIWILPFIFLRFSSQFFNTIHSN